MENSIAVPEKIYTHSYIHIHTYAYTNNNTLTSLLNVYTEYMRNTGLEEAQAGIKISGRNINNFRYADDTTLMAESEEEPKSLLMKLKEES